MTKRRVNLYVDAEVYERVQALCQRFGNEATPSAIANQAFAGFDAMFTPVLEKALAGDKEAAYRLVQQSGLNAIGDLSAMLRDAHTEQAQLTAKERAT
jgi:hypothetical protein